MATLSPAQLAALLALPVGRITLPANVSAEVNSNACWNWALNAGHGNIHGANSAPNLYEATGLWTFRDNEEPAEKLNLDVNAIPGHALEPTLALEWTNAKAEVDPNTNDRETFMRTMARIAARQNGLTPAPAGTTPYTLWVTVPGAEWYNWQHWALGFTVGMQTRYVQTEPNRDLYVGYDRVWEAERPGHLTVSINLNQIHDRHKEYIVLAIMQPPAAAVWRGDHTSNNCAVCGNAIAASTFMRITTSSNKHHCRRCGEIVCRACSTHTADIPNRLTRQGGRRNGIGNARVCDTCYALSQ